MVLRGICWSSAPFWGVEPRERFGNQALFKQDGENAPDSTGADGLTVVSLNNDSNLFLAIGRVCSANTQDELFFWFSPVAFVDRLGAFRWRRYTLFKFVQNALVAVIGCAGYAAELLTFLITNALGFQALPLPNFVFIQKSVNIETFLCTGVSVKFINILGQSSYLHRGLR